MKDALGHGSDKRGAPSIATAGRHQSGVLKIVQTLHDPLSGAGKNTFQTVSKPVRTAVAERIAQNIRADKGFARIKGG